jgi:hypothetical protein
MASAPDRRCHIRKARVTQIFKFSPPLIRKANKRFAVVKRVFAKDQIMEIEG